MVRLPKSLRLSLSALALVAAPAAGQLRPAPVAEIFESYNDCFAATNGGSLSPAELEKLGWARATMRDSEGKAIDGGPIIYGHGDRRPIILLSGLEGKGICVVNARIESLAVFDEFKAAFGGKLPKPNKDGEITYFAEGRAVQIAPTGNRSEPAVRLVVMTPAEKSE